jgi:hypothetical protein
VIDRIEASVGAVEGGEEGQHVDTREHSGQRTVEELAKRREGPTAEPVGVGDELDAVSHTRSRILPVSSLAEVRRTATPLAWEQVGSMDRRTPL